MVPATGSSAAALFPSLTLLLPGFGFMSAVFICLPKISQGRHAAGSETPRVVFLGPPIPTTCAREGNRMAPAPRLLLTMSFEAGAHWTLPAVLLLGFLAGIVPSYPLLPRGTSGTLLQRGWGSLAGMSGERSGVNWESDYLLGIKRLRRLYCNVGIGFHLQVLPDGGISGVHSEDPYSLLEISTVERGVVSLYGVKSQVFVAMSSRGRLYATAHFQDECKFRETLLPNHYNAYESRAYRGAYIGLSKHGRVKRGNKVSPAMSATHFLPRI
ncbi:fibroblast growth factor 6 [Rhinatrema bivittatum]|uniref:fibroblast growth factor 6 n=1 Tax=Rhinatrema bivittatum TaxID=194408 RepID=UPI001129F015|nr:fibroblast growth factor 6 [Rhinatrema bivittatum]